MEGNNKRIVKNTLFLYLRMLMTMCISFFTTRVILDKLGVSDYGIYNVVGGFISMFTLLNSILQTGTRRFLALNLGKKDAGLLKDTFSTAFVIHCLIAFIVLFLAETFGLWFLNTNLNFEQNRIEAANWVYQFSIIVVCLNITQTPYVAAVTAHEKFGIYAYLSIFDAFAKLLVVYLLSIISGDKLIIYSALLLGVNIISICFYRIYCIRHYSECVFSLRINRPLFREMMEFSGWSSIGNLSTVLNGQGVNMLLNMFFNTTVNASRGLANTVIYTIRQFVDGFITASVPQLVKYYGAGDTQKFQNLIFNISQYSLFLLSIFVVPVTLEVDYVLQLWLKEVPQYTAIFIKISMITSLISYSNRMVDQGVVAMGKMKQLALWTSPIYLLNFPLVYVVLKLGYSPVSAYVIVMLPTFLGLIVNLYILQKYNHFLAVRFFISVFLKNLLLILIATIIPVMIQSLMQQGLLRFVFVCIVSIISNTIVMYYWGLNSEVKRMVKNKIYTILHQK